MRIAGQRFLVIGRAGMDLYPDPPGTKTEHATRFQACLGGSSANIAAAIQRLGGSAEMLGCVSDDAVGRFVLHELVKYGIGHAHVRSVAAEARTSLALAETTLDDPQTVIYRNGAADFMMTDADIGAVDFAQHDALVVTGTALAAEPSRSATFTAFDRAGSAGLPLILDIDYRPYSWPSADVAADIYSRAGALCDVIVGNDVEFGFMAGAYDRGLEKARSLVAQGVAVAVYKMGEKGAITISRDGEIRTGIYRTNALKPTGAGDSFMGAFLIGLANGMALRDAVLQGSAAAAMVVARVGCAPAMPTRAELDAFMAGQAAPDAA